MKRYFLLFFVIIIASFLHAKDKAALQQKIITLLNNHCPDGANIFRLWQEKVPKSSQLDLMVLVTEGKDEQAIVKSLNVVVHEVTHNVNSCMAAVVLKEEFARTSDRFQNVFYFYLKNHQFILVERTPTFPARKMIDSFPEELRTFHFDYIDTDKEYQSTQIHGIYGLVDEMNAYYLGSQTAYDLYSWYQQFGAKANWHDYFEGVNSTLYACLEFKLYVLKYLIYARKHHPDKYSGIINNKNLIKTFLEVDQNVSDLVDTYFVKKKELYKQLHDYGWEVFEANNYLYIQKGNKRTGHMTFFDILNVMQQELSKPTYQRLSQELTDIVKNWDPAIIYKNWIAPLK